MGAELVILTGDNPVNDDVFVGDFQESVKGFFSKVGEAVKGGYGVQTPQGALSISEQGVQFVKPGPGAAPAPSGMVTSILKNPIVLGGAALIVLLLLMKKK
jgi:hypothetical protein